MPQGGQDVAQILPLPRRGPRCDRALADGERVVRHHGPLGHRVDDAVSFAARAGAFRGVGREGLCRQHRLPRRILPGARVQHAHQVRKGGHAADGGARARGPALLLQGDRRRQPVDVVDVRRRELIEEPPRVRRDRFEVAPLRLRVERAECEGRLARAGHAGEHDQALAREIDVDVLQIVLARATDANEVGGRHEAAVVVDTRPHRPILAAPAARSARTYGPTPISNTRFHRFPVTRIRPLRSSNAIPFNTSSGSRDFSRRTGFRTGPVVPPRARSSAISAR